MNFDHKLIKKNQWTNHRIIEIYASKKIVYYTNDNNNDNNNIKDEDNLKILTQIRIDNRKI